MLIQWEDNRNVLKDTEEDFWILNLVDTPMKLQKYIPSELLKISNAVVDSEHKTNVLTLRFKNLNKDFFNKIAIFFKMWIEDVSVLNTIYKGEFKCYSAEKGKEYIFKHIFPVHIETLFIFDPSQVTQINVAFCFDNLVTTINYQNDSIPQKNLIDDTNGNDIELSSIYKELTEWLEDPYTFTLKQIEGKTKYL